MFSSPRRILPLFFCNQKKSRKTVKEKFLQPPPSRSRVRLPPEGGINAPPETVWFLISTASPMGSRADFQFTSDARPPKALRASRGYYFDNSTKGAYLSRRLSRGWCGAGGSAASRRVFKGAAPRHLPLWGRLWQLRSRAPCYRRALKKSPGGGFFYQSSSSSGS